MATKNNRHKHNIHKNKRLQKQQQGEQPANKDNLQSTTE